MIMTQQDKHATTWVVACDQCGHALVAPAPGWSWWTDAVRAAADAGWIVQRDRAATAPDLCPDCRGAAS